MTGLLLLTLALSAGLAPALEVPAWARVAPAFEASEGETLEPPLERPLERPLRRFFRNAKRTLRLSVRIVANAIQTWLRWLRQSLKFVLVAVVVALFDRRLLEAWRRDGLRVLGSYVPMMVYAYGRLLLDRRVTRSGKLLLLFAIVYGVRRVDLIPDRNLFPGLVDDVLLIALATGTFLAACPPGVVQASAERAVRWRDRLRRSR